MRDDFDRITVAAVLTHIDAETPDDARRWHDHWLANLDSMRTARHAGDCTNTPATCPRCLVDQATALAPAYRAALAHVEHNHPGVLEPAGADVCAHAAADAAGTSAVPAEARELAIIHLTLFDDPGAPDRFHRHRDHHDAAFDTLRLHNVHAACNKLACPRCDLVEALARVPAMRELLCLVRTG